ncbi:probable basic-leucine zipper transcription factor N [Drosophila mojavensis]|uniref:SUZ RNA-binding domain-containing n=1 Tax=Drosophila mojavensis TaxID=7230 RepID=B4KFE5_DROMO|nr:probable basic-leucine zipper transcription factor N [Drosophila mojavensis]EDW12045.2 uncharacterized protein Dmoj_GI11836, isoform B [Drosophila mojavensis]
MSNGDDVLDNWEEIDEAGLCMTLQTKLQTADDDSSCTLKPAPTAETPATTAASGKMKLLQRPQSMQESSGGGSTATAADVAPKQIMIAKKQPTSATSLDDESSAPSPPVMMVLHKSSSEYDAANYATPISNQTVKILRRPAQAEERRDMNGIRPKQPIKTLQQREQEYAQARLRILGSAKNPEDDKPAAAATLVVLSTPVQPEVTTTTPTAFNFNNNINNNNSGIGIQSVNNASPGMHRSTSAPKMSQTAPFYNNYNNYYQPPPNTAPMGYFYQQTPSMHQPHQQQQQHQQTSPQSLAHYNQRLSQYMTGASVTAAGAATANPQQSWSPVVGGSVSAALLRQQSLHTPSLQQHQAQPQPPPPQYAHPYNDNVLRLPRGPCPNGTIGFQMRR